jgi:Cu2+-exporting ATPase
MNHDHHTNRKHESHDAQEYTCPMHLEVIKKEPGKCPGCGMDLIPKEKGSGEHAGHDMSKMSHMDHEAAMTNPQMAKAMEADMRRRFWISFLLSIPIFLYSPVGVNLLKLHLPAPIPVSWILLIPKICRTNMR